MKLLLVIAIASVIVASGLTLAITSSSNDSSAYVYVPSDITKANPNLKVVSGSAAFMTIDPADVKEKIKHTVIGKVISVGDAIDWEDPDGLHTYGAVPITLKIKENVKGELPDKNVTFYIHGIYEQGEFYIMPHMPQFEIGEKTLVHLGVPDIGFRSDAMYVELGEHGKYKIIGDKAYNEKFKQGKNLDSAKKESK